jgi:thiol-disulfide isomerase/thioredoxin
MGYARFFADGAFVTRTTLLAAGALLLVTAAALGLVWRAGGRDASAVGRLASMTSGRGLTLQFSDKPMAVPAMSLVDLDGHPVSMDAARGKVVLLNFWATWCGPCREEIPELVALQKHYADMLLVVGLSIDTRPPAEVKAFAEQFSLNYPVAIASDELQRDFGGISAVPSTFVVNPSGRIVQRHVGMLNPAITEHEVRALAGLPTEATVETVKDTGQVLLTNAAYATDIPGLELEKLTPTQREAVLKRLNTEDCTCGCELTLAQCRINDPSCDVSLPAAKKVVDEVCAAMK